MASCTPAPRRCRRGTRRHKLPRGQLTPWCLTACVRGNLAALGRLTVRGAAASASARERGRGGQRSRRLHQRGTPADHQHTRVLQCPAAPRCTAPPLQPGGAGQAHSEAERLRRHQHAREGEVGKGRDACTCEARQQTTSTPACCNVQQRHAAPTTIKYGKDGAATSAAPTAWPLRDFPVQVELAKHGARRHMSSTRALCAVASVLGGVEPRAEPRADTPPSNVVVDLLLLGSRGTACHFPRSHASRLLAPSSQIGK
jgi:hypothetical protein